jgi:heat shock protein HtpX
MMNQLKTIFLLGTLSAILVAIGGSLGEGALYLAVGLAVVMNFGAYFFSDRLVLAMQRAREVGPSELPWLRRMVDDLARRAQIPPPRLYVVPQAQPNAFATGRNPEHGVVAVTEGILDILDERELRGVLAHEIAHIKNRDILVATIAATVAAAVTYIAHILQWSAIFGGSRDDEDSSPLAGLVLAIVAPLAATVIQLAISRSREYLADATGAQLAGDPEPLARSLEKLHYASERIPAHVEPATASLFIVSPLSAGRSLSRLFSTHPPMEERVTRLRSMARDGARRRVTPTGSRRLG